MLIEDNVTRTHTWRGKFWTIEISKVCSSANNGTIDFSVILYEEETLRIVSNSEKWNEQRERERLFNVQIVQLSDDRFYECLIRL